MAHGSLQHGQLEVICGPMFSGKTEELLRRIRRAQIARQRVQVFKPALDTRFGVTTVVSHSAQSMESTPVNDALDILEFVKDSTRIVAIDEVQFFAPSIVAVTQKLVARGLRVIVAGLDLDYLGRPFGSMGELLACADEVAKIQAICTICGAPASRSQRLSVSKEKILLGEKESYEARCRSHFDGEEEVQYEGNPNSDSPNILLNSNMN